MASASCHQLILMCWLLGSWILASSVRDLQSSTSEISFRVLFVSSANLSSLRLKPCDRCTSLSIGLSKEMWCLWPIRGWERVQDGKWIACSSRLALHLYVADVCLLWTKDSTSILLDLDYKLNSARALVQLLCCCAWVAYCSRLMCLSDRTLSSGLMALMRLIERYLVDPASSHMLCSRIKPCMSKYEHVLYCETADSSLYQL